MSAARSRRVIAIALFCAGLLSCASAVAQTFRIDDSASQVLSPGEVKMRWESLVPRPGQPSTITGQVAVRVVLDVSPWRAPTSISRLLQARQHNLEWLL